MRLALLEIAVLAVLTSVVGSIIVVRNLDYLSEALSHGVFPGIVLAFILNVNLIFGALFTATLAAVGIAQVSDNKKISSSNATGIIFTSAFALGIILVSSLANYRANLANLLVGDILGVSAGDVALTAAVTGLVLIVVGSFYRQVLAVCFDPVFAQVAGVNVKAIDLLIYFLIAITITISMQAVGTVLIVAICIIPATTAKLHSKSLFEMLLRAMLYSLVCGLIGIYLTYYLQLAAGAAIVLCNAAWFGINLLIFQPGKGIKNRQRFNK